MRSFKIIVEKHKEGYVAYPLGLKGIVEDLSELKEGVSHDRDA